MYKNQYSGKQNTDRHQLLAQHIGVHVAQIRNLSEEAYDLVEQDVFEGLGARAEICEQAVNLGIEVPLSEVLTMSEGDYEALVLQVEELEALATE